MEKALDIGTCEADSSAAKDDCGILPRSTLDGVFAPTLRSSVKSLFFSHLDHRTGAGAEAGKQIA
jgi:hypothetical protein